MPSLSKHHSIDRRGFLIRTISSFLGLVFAAPVVSQTSWKGIGYKGLDQALVKVKLPSIADLPDPTLVRIIDTTHPITQAEIADLVQPFLIPIPLQLDGIRAANENIYVNSIIFSSLAKLFEQANKDRTGLFIHSGFRTFEQQAIAYSQANDKQVVLKPGTSQHHSGLAVDFTSTDIGKLVDINLHFENTKAGKWLIEHAWEYGFIRSYTGSHDGIKDEPWHYLYIGKDLAEAFIRLKSSGWYGDAFLLQHAVNLGMHQIVIETT